MNIDNDDVNIPSTPDSLSEFETIRGGKALRRKINRIPKPIEKVENFKKILEEDDDDAKKDDKAIDFKEKYLKWKKKAIGIHEQYSRYICNISSDIEDSIIQLQEILKYSDNIIDTDSNPPFSTVKKEKEKKSDGKRKRKSKSRRRRRKSKSKF
jgi:hypothetical protein